MHDIGDEECLIEIEGLSVIQGNIPSRALEIAIERAILHKEELIANWERSSNLDLLKKILPLH